MPRHIPEIFRVLIIRIFNHSDLFRISEFGFRNYLSALSCLLQKSRHHIDNVIQLIQLDILMDPDMRALITAILGLGEIAQTVA
jgi:hypothetical protein